MRTTILYKPNLSVDIDMICEGFVGKRGIDAVVNEHFTASMRVRNGVAGRGRG